MDEEQPTKRKPGRPKKETFTETEAFTGFTQDNIYSEYYYTPAIWLDVCAAIDNLAELKVVQYILRHTWGYRDYNTAKYITVDEFVHGRKYKQGERKGERMDIGTRLSDRAVQEGLARAMKHGWVVCFVDDSDLARVKKYYALNMQAESIELSPDEEDDQQDYGMNDNPDGVNNIHPPTNVIRSKDESYSYRSKERTLEETTKKDGIRNTPPSVNNFENIRYLPPPHERRGKIPDFIKITLEQFSRDLGDYEHTASNIGQAFRLYESTSGDPDTFMALLDEAKAKARTRTNIKKKNSKGDINRMPFFFACLRKSLSIEAVREG